MAALRQQELRETVHSAFLHYDADRSGAIDVKELTNLVADLGGFLTEKELEAALHALDKNHDGVIEEDEFTTWWMSQTNDLDGDGHVGELERALDRVRSTGQSRFRVDVHSASWRGQLDVVQRLIDEDPELASEVDRTEFGAGNTPLHYGAYQGHHALCSYLLAHGAKVNVSNAQGCTPVFLAAQQGRANVVELLLEHGADIKIYEKQHRWTAVDVAANDAIINVFRDRIGGVPCAPDAPSVLDASDSSLTIHWNIPNSRHDQTTPTSGYKIRVTSLKTPDNIRSLLVAPYPTQCVVSSLEPDTEYAVQVAAFNLHGIGPYSKPGCTTRTRPAKPAPPSQLRSRTIDAQSIELTWSRGSNNLDSEINYVVQQCLDDVGDLWKEISTSASTEARLVVSNLLDNTKHRFRIAAVSKCSGQSEFSAVHEARCRPDATALKNNPSQHSASRCWNAIKARKPDRSPKEITPTTMQPVGNTAPSTLLGQSREPLVANLTRLVTQDSQKGYRVAEDHDCKGIDHSSEDEDHVFFEEDTE